MADTVSGRRRRVTPGEVAAGRRAKLRKRVISDMTDPETTGDLERTDRIASLIFIGAPGGAAKSAARFGPKGFKVAKKGAESVGKYVMRVLKPVLGKSVKK